MLIHRGVINFFSVHYCFYIHVNAEIIKMICTISLNGVRE